MKAIVIKVPRSESPLWVREAWLGLILRTDGLCPAPGTLGVVTGQELEDESDHVWLVPMGPAIAVLAAANPEAAQWWYDHGYPQPGRRFTFQEAELREIGKPDDVAAWG